MKRFKFKTLTMRIWTTFTVIILIIICCISFLYLFAYRRIAENARVQDLKVAHDILKGGNYNQPNRFDELRNLRGSSHFILNINDNNIVQIIDITKRQGPLQSSPPYYGIGDRTVKLWMAGFAKDDTLNEKVFKETYNKMDFTFIISSIKDGHSGRSYLVSYMPDIEDNSLLYIVIAIGIIFIIIGFFTAKLVAGRISKPLKELEDYTVRIAHKDWKEPIEIKSEDEIGRLAKSMNRMQRELKHADEEEKVFLQSISHDLKTPVMVIMSHADAIMDGVYIDSVEKTAEIIRDEAIRLEKKIKQMLYLNTLDYTLENNSENTEFNLRNAIKHIISRFEVVNSTIGWVLDFDDVYIRGNEDKIQVSIENILDNGIRYAEHEIRVSLKREGDFAVLEIYNDGPGISEDHIEHIFDNLYKDKTGNFGLGLAISKKIVDFYGGEIKAENKEKGVSFIIKYPVCERNYSSE